MEERAPRLAFLVLLVVFIAAFIGLIRPFLLPIIFAALIAIICDPIDRIFLRLFRQRKYLASLFTTLFVAICILAPLGIAVTIIILKSADAVSFVTGQLQSGQVAASLDSANAWLNSKLVDYANYLPADFNIRATMLEIIQEVGKTVYQYSPKVISATANIAGGLLLVVIFMFVFFAQGGAIYSTIMGLLPLKEEHKQILARDVRLVISATFLGQIATSCAQGLLIGIGFWIAGIGSPAFWGLVAVGVTMIPVVGGPLMYVPAAIAMGAGGHTGSAIFIMAYGIGVVSMIDNIIKPLVMRGKVNVSPLFLALGLIGGGLWMGAAGIIVGPLIVVLMLTMIKIYQREFI